MPSFLPTDQSTNFLKSIKMLPSASFDNRLFLSSLTTRLTAGCFAAMAGFVWMDAVLAPHGLSMTLGTFASSCCLLFALPQSPVSQARPVLPDDISHDSYIHSCSQLCPTHNNVQDHDPLLSSVLVCQAIDQCSVDESKKFPGSFLADIGGPSFLLPVCRGGMWWWLTWGVR